MEPPHAEVERSEPIPEPPRSGRHADRRSRTEPVELARRRHRAWRRAPAVEEARGRRERIAEVAASMARGSGEGRASDQTHRGRFEASRDGVWLARWLSARDIEAHVIHALSPRNQVGHLTSSEKNGNCLFAADPEQAFDQQSIFWAPEALSTVLSRSEERRVGKEC